MKELFVFLFISSVFIGHSQENLNTYKYIIVPKKFESFKKENQYKTSTLVKHLFTKNGFNAVYDDVLPEELENNRCLGLRVSVNEESSMFTTKTAMVLKDCSSKEVLTTVMGSSKEKDYESAYREALTEAFASIKALNYQYSPTELQEGPRTNTDVAMEEKKYPKNKVDQKVVIQVATPEDQSYKSVEPVASTIEKVDSVANEMKVGEQKDLYVLYAQPIPKGFQLVDNTPKVRLKIYHTSMQDVYTVTHEKDNGVVYKNDGKWYLEYYWGDQLQTEELNIKF